MDYNFNSIAGYAEEKAELKRLCEIFNNREELTKKGAKLPKGIIFYGEPGTGKTLFSKVLSTVCGLKTLKIDLGKMESDGEICRVVKRTFEKASKAKVPTMIFFDEMDKVLPDPYEKYYTDRSKTILTQLLTLIDGMDSARNIVFVATCNNYSALPKALTRAGRLDKKIGLGAPSQQSRKEILQMYIDKTACKFEMDIEEMAKICDGFTCSALETLVNECVLRSLDDRVDRSTIRDSASEIRNEDIKREVDKFEALIYAVRNVGAFVVAKSFYDGPFSLTINDKTVCNDFYDKVFLAFEDYDDYDFDDFELLKTLSMKELTEMITILMGGCIAQEIIMGENYGNIRDYHIVANTILKYILSTGFLGANYTVYSFRENVLSYSSKRERELNEKLDKIMIECCEKARVIVEENIHLIDDLALCLADKKELNENETRNFLSNWTYVDDENDDKNE